MGFTSGWHWLIVLAVVLLLFGGRGKIPSLMKDMGQGITAFRKGLKDGKNSEDKNDDEKALEKDTVESSVVKDADKETTAKS